jgi:hypothetical protein
MQARRALLRFALALVPVTAVAIACSFPDVTFGTTEGGDGGGPIIEDGAVNEASTRSDAQQVIVDANVCATRTKCDCDEDGYAREDCEVPLSTIQRDGGGTLQAGDCDDYDPLRNPGQTQFLKIKPPERHAGDWNCNNTVERQIRVGFTCSGNGLTGCSPPAFEGTPPCGSEGVPYLECRPAGAVGPCNPVELDRKDVYCR